jgi:type IV pilus assembly protein PilV
MKKIRRSDRGKNRDRGLSAVNAAGFTLLEVLVAIMILTFGLLAVGSMQISAIRGNFMSGNTSMAVTLAGEKMEDLLNTDYSHADLKAGKHGPESISKTGADDEGGLYRRSWTVTDRSSPVRKDLVVTVTWENNRHRLSIASVKNNVKWGL